MKRRVLIAKALSHEPTVLFLDEPSASVDVELRKDMWGIVKRLKQKVFAKLITGYTHTSHNGCRLKKKKRIKIRTRTKKLSKK